MPAKTDVRLVKRGIEELLDASLKRLAPKNRAMMQPLIDAIENARVTGNDRADAKALSERIEATFAKMDNGPIAEAVERILLQTYAVGRTAAVPEDIPAEFDLPPMTLQEELAL